MCSLADTDHMYEWGVLSIMKLVRRWSAPLAPVMACFSFFCKILNRQKQHINRQTALTKREVLFGSKHAVVGGRIPSRGSAGDLSSFNRDEQGVEFGKNEHVSSSVVVDAKQNSQLAYLYLFVS